MNPFEPDFSLSTGLCGRARPSLTFSTDVRQIITDDIWYGDQDSLALLRTSVALLQEGDASGNHRVGAGGSRLRCARSAAQSVDPHNGRLQVRLDVDRRPATTVDQARPRIPPRTRLTVYATT